MTTAVLNPAQKVTASVIFAAEPGGPPVPVDGIPVWTKTDTDDSVCRIDVALDGMSVVIHYVADGTSTVQVTADADRTVEGIRQLIGVLTVACTQPEATVVDITVGTPEADVPTPTPV